VISLDILPTLLAAAGGAVLQGLTLDGRDAIPALRGEKQASDRSLFWDYRGYSAVRKGRHKLIREAPDKPFHLFDLDKDIGEATDLAQQQPEIIADLQSELERWMRQFNR
jgi:arylsulfatase A-like enzyme